MFAKSIGSVCRVLMIAMVLSGIIAFASQSPVHAQGGILCAITVGGGGTSETYRAYMSEGATVGEFPSIKASDFIRRTTGPCTFTVFNEKEFNGRSVTIGTELNDRIRAGLDGVERRDGGGGDTWRIRSIRIEWVGKYSCGLKIGGNGVRMWYFQGLHPSVPAMNRIEYFEDWERSNNSVCEATLYNSTGYQGKSYFVGAYRVGGGPLDPDFRARSLVIGRVSP